MAKHKNNCIRSDYNGKNHELSDIVNTAKIGPGSKFLDGVLYFDQNFKQFESFGKTMIYIIEKTL